MSSHWDHPIGCCLNGCLLNGTTPFSRLVCLFPTLFFFLFIYFCKSWKVFISNMLVISRNYTHTFFPLFDWARKHPRYFSCRSRYKICNNSFSGSLDIAYKWVSSRETDQQRDRPIEGQTDGQTDAWRFNVLISMCGTHQMWIIRPCKCSNESCIYNNVRIFWTMWEYNHSNGLLVCQHNAQVAWLNVTCLNCNVLKLPLIVLISCH